MSNKTVNTTVVPQLSLSEAVVEAVNEIKVKGSFSAHDVTNAVRSAVNAGEITIPGSEAKPNSQNIKYWINHEDVKAVIDALLEDGTLKNLGLVNVTYNGNFRVFNFAANATPAAVVTVATNPAESPVEKRIKAYLAKVGSATLRQIQSALKINGVTCQALAEVVVKLGYKVVEGTPGCYSTYVVS